MLDPSDKLLKEVEAVLQKPLSMAQLDSVLRRVGQSIPRFDDDSDSLDGPLRECVSLAGASNS
jgi:hypothetical protein